MEIDYQAIIDEYLAVFEELHKRPVYKMEYINGWFHLQIGESSVAVAWRRSQIEEFTARMLRRIEEKKSESLHSSGA